MTLRAATLVMVMALLAAPGRAHDTWLVADGRGLFALATGNRYPAGESAPPASSLLQRGCVDGSGRRLALRPVADAAAPATRAPASEDPVRDLAEARSAAAALPLRTAGPATAPRACWAGLQAHTIDLEPALVDVYFREIRPGAAVLARLAAQREAGHPWRERYRKFARVERTQGNQGAAVLQALRRPLGLPLEIVPEGDQPLRAGQAASFRVLSAGRPVAGLAVELVSSRNRLGVWARSDEEGRIRHVLPFRGDWLLRATLLDLPGEDGVWNSRFVTLAFEAS